MKEYFVARLCNKADGTAVCPVTVCETEESALREFFKLCSTAVGSEHPVDTIIMVDKEGYEVRRESFEHEVAADDAN